MGEHRVLRLLLQAEVGESGVRPQQTVLGQELTAGRELVGAEGVERMVGHVKSPCTTGEAGSGSSARIEPIRSATPGSRRTRTMA